LDEGDDHASVDDELRELGSPLIRQPTMPQDEIPQMTELHEREVGRKRGLHAFFADDSKANIRLLYHGDVVSAVANASYPFLIEVFDRPCHEGFLRRAASAYAD
jgi:hypothetical protein